MDRENKISLKQLQALVLVNSIGMLSAVIPPGVSMISGKTGWLFVLIGGVIIGTIMAMAVSCGGVYTWFMESKVGNFLALLICGKIVLCGGVWLRLFSQAINGLLLEQTPTWGISLVMVLLAGYGAYKGIETRARFAEIGFVFIIFVLLFIYLLSAENVQVANLRPISFKGGGKAIFFVVSSAFGIEYLLFAQSYTNGEKKGRAVFFAGVLGAVLMSAVVAFCVGVFGVNGVIERRFAVLQIMDTIDFPLMLLERQDVLMMGLWIFSLFAFINGAIFYGGEILSRVVMKKGVDLAMFLIAMALVFAVSIVPKNIDVLGELIGKAGILNIIVQGVIILAFIFKGRGKA